MEASLSRALRYFSTHCWAWKQRGAQRGFLRGRASVSATAKSSSAFVTHSRVLAFIHDPALRHNQFDEHVSLSLALGDKLRLAHHQIHRKRRIKMRADLDGLPHVAAPEGQDDKQI